jgi:hypothetical protein
MNALPSRARICVSKLWAPILAFLACATSSQGQDTWLRMSPANSPPARANSAAVYYLSRDRVVLFAGHTPAVNLADTWEWDGVNWLRVAPTVSPTARWAHAMAFDLGRNVVVLFGGGTNNLGNMNLSDTWEYDGITWTQRNPTTVPGPRLGHDMVWDPVRRRVIMFGGRNGTSGYADTWEWDGNNWNQLTPATSPPARCCHSMVSDLARSRVVLYGGWLSSNFGDTWEWDGTNWLQRSPARSMGARWGHKLSYDLARGRVVSFGGATTTTYTNDTFEWDGVDWIQKGPGPGGRIGHVVPFQLRRARVLMFGGTGSTYFADTWEYFVNNPASYSTYGSGCPGSNTLVPLLDNVGLPILGGVLRVNLARARAGSFALLLLGFRQTSLDLGSSGAPGCSLLVAPNQVLATPTDTAGNASIGLSVPNDQSLTGTAFFTQYAVSDQGANALGFVMSRGGRGTPGY